jgi:hypothetical protein
VQVGTASFTDPSISEELTRKLTDALLDVKLLSISELQRNIAIETS